VVIGCWSVANRPIHTLKNDITHVPAAADYEARDAMYTPMIIFLRSLMYRVGIMSAAGKKSLL